MEILLICEDDDVYHQTLRVFDGQVNLTRQSFKNMQENVDYMSYDILIVDFDQTKVDEKNYKVLLDIKCKNDIPMLALLEKSSILDQFEVLSLGALDYLERPVGDEIYLAKLNQIFKWKWYYDWKKQKDGLIKD